MDDQLWRAARDWGLSWDIGAQTGDCLYLGSEAQRGRAFSKDLNQWFVYYSHSSVLLTPIPELSALSPGLYEGSVWWFDEGVTLNFSGWAVFACFSGVGGRRFLGVCGMVVITPPHPLPFARPHPGADVENRQFLRDCSWTSARVSAPQGFGVTGCHGLGSEGGHSMHVSSTTQVNHDWEGFAVTSTSGQTYSSKINRLIGRSHFLRLFSHAACFSFQISSAHICIEDGCVCLCMCVSVYCVSVYVCVHVYCMCVYLVRVCVHVCV